MSIGTERVSVPCGGKAVKACNLGRHEKNCCNEPCVSSRRTKRGGTRAALRAKALANAAGASNQPPSRGTQYRGYSPPPPSDDYSSYGIARANDSW